MTTTTRKYTCLPTHHELLMMRLPGETEQHVTVSSPDGLSIRAVYVHAHTGAVLRSVELNFQRDVKLHFIASKWEGFYFILQFSSFYQRYGCSCMDGKHYQQTHKPCDHMKMLMEVAHV